MLYACMIVFFACLLLFLRPMREREITNLSFDEQNGWMTQLYKNNAWREITLNNVFLPGSHDSGTGTNSNFYPKMKSNLLMNMLHNSRVVDMVSKTQKYTPIQQFIVGSRYFDCRIHITNNSTAIWKHGVVLYDAPFNHFITQLNHILELKEFSHELVLIKCSHFGGMYNQVNITKLETDIAQILQDKLISVNKESIIFNKTISSLLSKGRVVLIFDTEYECKTVHKPNINTILDQGWTNWQRHTQCGVQSGLAYTTRDVIHYLECITDRQTLKAQIYPTDLKKYKNIRLLNVTQAHIQYDTTNFLNMFTDSSLLYNALCKTTLPDIKHNDDVHNVNIKVMQWIQTKITDSDRIINIVQFNFVDTFLYQFAYTMNESVLKRVHQT